MKLETSKGYKLTPNPFLGKFLFCWLMKKCDYIRGCLLLGETPTFRLLLYVEWSEMDQNRWSTISHYYIPGFEGVLYIICCMPPCILFIFRTSNIVAFTNINTMYIFWEREIFLIYFTSKYVWCYPANGVTSD